MTDYVKIFDPPPAPVGFPGAQVADRADPFAYVYDDGLVLAVNVALATGRPLLLRGSPGTGKSSLAESVAAHLARRFYPHTISSRTQARDLLWTIDEVARLSDATSRDGAARDRAHYVVPGPLWWAFDPDGAARRGLAGGDLVPDPNEGTAEAAGSVVLLDEIDKADPDVPNDLLEPLGRYQFRTDAGETVEAREAPLVIMTTNEERDLPRAFLRRCVVHVLPLPTRGRLREIATVRFGAADIGLYDDIVRTFTSTDGSDDEHVDVSIAEFLDAVVAARELGLRPGDPRWPDVLAATTSKPVTVELR